MEYNESVGPPQPTDTSATVEFIEDAFREDGATYVRILYAADLADAEGAGLLAAALRSYAEELLVVAHGHLDQLRWKVDAAGAVTCRTADDMLNALINREREQAEDMLPAARQTAETEGFLDVADWLLTTLKWKHNAAERLRQVSKQAPPSES